MQSARRRFLHSLAAVPFVPALAAQTPKAASPPPSPTPAPEASGVEAAARLLGEFVRQRFGAQLEPDDLAAIVKNIQDNLESAERLREFPLGNSDEPVTVFQARPPARPAAGGRS